MMMIVGLGNPGKDYENTRHNVGFEVIDKIAQKAGIDVRFREGKAFTGKGVYEGQRVLLVKPQTYMNLSGESVQALTSYYKIDPTSELIVISDDVSLAVGKLRIRKKGSAGGHNGLKNIIQNLGTDGFMRIKVGVGEKPKEYDLADWVLGHFGKEDRKIMDESVDRAAKAIAAMMLDGPDSAMNQFN